MICRFDQLSQYRQRVTLVDGSFDPLHPGHLEYFQKAKSFGLPLVCNISPDSYTATKHPILIPAADRAQILDALRVIDVVHVAEGPTADVLRELQPQIYAKGDGWAGKLPKAEIDICQARHIAIKFTGRASQSSSALLRQFQPDVDRFEELVQWQKPAEKPWTPVLPYTIEARREAEGKQPQLIKEVFAPRRVLDYGCGAGYLVAFLSELGVNVEGYEREESLREMAPPYVSLRVRGHINSSYSNKGTYDLVICREVLEHCTIREIKDIVRRLCYESSQYLYITTRFAKAPRHLLSVDTADDLDPTHCTMLHQDFLRTLIVLEGFKRRADLEHKMDWQQKGRVLVYERV